MDLINLNAMLALAPQPQPGQSAPPMWTSFVPLVLIMVVFYFIFIRPQQKRAREQAAMLKSVRSGDKVTTSGGIIGQVITVKEKTLTLRTADAKIEITKSAVVDIDRSGETSES
jgi:preprotein translocase subunit YajC